MPAMDLRPNFGERRPKVWNYKKRRLAPALIIATVLLVLEPLNFVQTHHTKVCYS